MSSKPYLIKSTQKVRAIIVPSRVHPGKFFALPQSPRSSSSFSWSVVTTVISRLSAASVMKTYAPSVSLSLQVDLEMSFVAGGRSGYRRENPARVWKNSKASRSRCLSDASLRRVYGPGVDAPDLRFGLEPSATTSWLSLLQGLRRCREEGRPGQGYQPQGCGDMSRKDLDGLTEFVKVMGQKAWPGLRSKRAASGRVQLRSSSRMTSVQRLPSA